MLQSLEVIVKVAEFIWDHIGVWQETEGLLAKPMLHFGYVDRQLVLACDLLGGRKVIDLLVLVEAFVEIRLAGAT